MGFLGFSEIFLGFFRIFWIFGNFRDLNKSPNLQLSFDIDIVILYGIFRNFWDFLELLGILVIFGIFCDFQDFLGFFGIFRIFRDLKQSVRDFFLVIYPSHVCVRVLVFKIITVNYNTWIIQISRYIFKWKEYIFLLLIWDWLGPIYDEPVKTIEVLWWIKWQWKLGGKPAKKDG